jgi:hypothetical protein
MRALSIIQVDFWEAVSDEVLKETVETVGVTIGRSYTPLKGAEGGC